MVSDQGSNEEERHREDITNQITLEVRDAAVFDVTRDQVVVDEIKADRWD